MNAPQKKDVIAMDFNYLLKYYDKPKMSSYGFSNFLDIPGKQCKQFYFSPIFSLNYKHKDPVWLSNFRELLSHLIMEK